MNLLSFPSLVEAPFVIVKIGKYTLGKYTNNASGYIGYANGATISYPNFIDSLEVTKINGEVNTYTLNLVYAITQGCDPNLIDKILSTVSDTRKITLSYGDSASPSFIYKEEEVLITNVTTRVDYSGSKITYAVSCVSTSLALKAGSYNFPSYDSKKPSDLIKELLNNESYGLKKIFYGMKDTSSFENLIVGSDVEVKIEAKKKMSVLDYLNYLVNCMTPNTESNSDLSKTKYFLKIVDSIDNEYGGPYFEIVSVSSDTPTINSLDTFEVDVGYPGNTLVTSFSINTNESYALLYKYSQEFKQSSYVYKIGDDGKLYADYSPNILTSKSLQYTTELDKTWWSKMVNMPITATITIKGLVRPAILMSYVNLNVVFYGVQHTSSGLYIITKQVDTIDGSGYRTTLSLTRISNES